jgi:hypothetical protein
MPAALQIVQSMFPKVKHIVNAKKGIALTVNERDVKSATKKDHNGCAMAVACKRELGVDGAIISTRTAYIVDGDTATRYAVGHTVNREITSLDRGAGFAPGDYTLQRPQSVAPRGSGTRHAGDPGPGTLRHKTYHHVEGTRDTLHSLLPAPKRKSKRR